MKKLKYLKLWENFEIADPNPDMENIPHEGNFTIERSTEPSSYEGEPDEVSYVITLNGGLNLGNNFTYDHFVGALKESEDAMEIVNAIGQMESDAKVTIIAKGNYGMVEEYWVVEEFPSWEEEDLPQESFDDEYDIEEYEESTEDLFEKWWANGGLDFSDYLYRDEAIKNMKNELLEYTSHEDESFGENSQDEISYWNIIIGECENIARKNEAHLKYPNATQSFRDMLNGKMS
jgi:hypothetical protein